MLSEILKPLSITGGAVPVLLLFVTVFIAVLGWSLRKSQRPIQNHMANLPLEEEK